MTVNSKAAKRRTPAAIALDPAAAARLFVDRSLTAAQLRAVMSMADAERVAWSNAVARALELCAGARTPALPDAATSHPFDYLPAGSTARVLSGAVVKVSTPDGATEQRDIDAHDAVLRSLPVGSTIRKTAAGVEVTVAGKSIEADRLPAALCAHMEFAS